MNMPVMRSTGQQNLACFTYTNPWQFSCLSQFPQLTSVVDSAINKEKCFCFFLRLWCSPGTKWNHWQNNVIFPFSIYLTLFESWKLKLELTPLIIPQKPKMISVICYNGDPNFYKQIWWCRTEHWIWHIFLLVHRLNCTARHTVNSCTSPEMTKTWKY